MVLEAKVAVTPLGAPLTLSVTAAFNAEPAVEVIVVCAFWPLITLNETGEALSDRVFEPVVDAAVQLLSNRFASTEPMPDPMS